MEACHKIFVVGNSRSGTTLMARILGQHPSIYAFGELHFLEQMVTGEEFLENQRLSQDDAYRLTQQLLFVAIEGYFASLDKSKYANQTEQILNTLETPTPATIFSAVTSFLAQQENAEGIVEQTPRNVFYIEEILAHYPSAKFINMVRDPRDVLLSQKKKWRRRFLGGKQFPIMETMRTWANYHPYIISKIWKAAVGEAANQPSTLTVRYEDLVESPQKVVQQVAEFCGYEFDPSMLDVAQVGSSSQADQSETRGVSSSRVSAWKNGGLKRYEVQICEKIVGNLAVKNGYQLSGFHGNRIPQFISLAFLPIKLSLALLLNIRRVKGLVSWARKRLFS